MTNRHGGDMRLAVIATPAALLVGRAAPAGDQMFQSDVAALKADAAQKSAEAAIAEAKKASQKVDEAFRKSLRK